MQNAYDDHVSCSAKSSASPTTTVHDYIEGEQYLVDDYKDDYDIRL